MSKETPKKTQLNIEMTPEEKKEVEDLADSWGMQIGRFIRDRVLPLAAYFQKHLDWAQTEYLVKRRYRLVCLYAARNDFSHEEGYESVVAKIDEAISEAKTIDEAAEKDSGKEVKSE